MSSENHVHEKITKWAAQFANNEKVVNFNDLKILAEDLGFSAKIDEKSLIIKEDDKKSTENDPKIEPMDAIIPEITSPKIRSPLNDIELCVNIATSSPIKQSNKISDTLMKIINLAKDALDNDCNSTYTKSAFVHKRISDIKISPLAMNTSGNHLTTDLNVTKTKESPTILKPTPKKKGAVIVKPPVEKIEQANDKKTNNTSGNFRRSVLQPMHSNLQALRSKLRTPTQMKTSTSSLGTRSAGAPSKIAAPPERRSTMTPLRREPVGFSRLKYPSTLRK